MADLRITDAPFDPAAELADFDPGDAGAVVSFTGRVRGGPVRAMTLERYPGMTEKQARAILAEAVRRWHLDACRVVHRYGRLCPGEPIVFVATAAAHRREAFAAAEFLMDWLKARAPFWKREETAEGVRWVEARDADDEAARRWEDS